MKEQIKERVRALMHSKNYDDIILGVTLAIKQKLGRKWIAENFNPEPNRSSRKTLIYTKSYGVYILGYYQSVVSMRPEKNESMNDISPDWEIIKTYE